MLFIAHNKNLKPSHAYAKSIQLTLWKFLCFPFEQGKKIIKKLQNRTNYLFVTYADRDWLFVGVPIWQNKQYHRKDMLSINTRTYITHLNKSRGSKNKLNVLEMENRTILIVNKQSKPIKSGLKNKIFVILMLQIFFFFQFMALLLTLLTKLQQRRIYINNACENKQIIMRGN